MSVIARVAMEAVVIQCLMEGRRPSAASRAPRQARRMPTSTGGVGRLPGSGGDVVAPPPTTAMTAALPPRTIASCRHETSHPSKVILRSASRVALLAGSSEDGPSRDKVFPSAGSHTLDEILDRRPWEILATPASQGSAISRIPLAICVKAVTKIAAMSVPVPAQKK